MITAKEAKTLVERPNLKGSKNKERLIKKVEKNIRRACKRGYHTANVICEGYAQGTIDEVIDLFVQQGFEDLNPNYQHLHRVWGWIELCW